MIFAKRLGSHLAIFALLILAWHALVVVFEVRPFIFPTPIAVFRSLVAGLGSGLYLRHVLVTLTETLSGFALAAVGALTLATAISLSERARTYAYPYVVFFQSVPKVALAPIVVVWFGLGLQSKIVNVALMSFFPLMVNTIAGLGSASRDRIDLLRSFGANEVQIFRLLRLPTALPYIAAGAEVSMIFALIGAIVAEFVGSQAGLGVLLQTMNSNLDLAGQFAVLVILAAIGFLLNRMILFSGDRLLWWQPSRKRSSY